jgi:adenylate cyclase
MYEPEPCVAVLPLANSSGDPEQSYFCEGIAAEILICLARTPGVRIVARSSVFGVDWSILGLRETGRLLNATAVLNGEVLNTGDKLSINVELFDIAEGRNVWTGQFDQDALDVFVVQDEIVAGVVGGLGVEVEDSRIRKIQERHTANVEAYQLYLEARHFYWQFSRSGIEKALDLFRQSIAANNEYALAYSGISDCYWYLHKYVESLDEYLEKADSASLHALKLSPDLAEAHASRGVALALCGRFDESETAFERATELDPELFEARFLYARSCFSEGQLEQAARLFVEANEIRPEDYQSLLLAGQAYEALGDAEKATDYRERGVTIAEEHLFLNPNETRALYMGANGLVSIGRIEAGLEWARRARELEPTDPMMLYNVGCIYALVGEIDEALTCLEQAVTGGLRQRGWFDHDPNLDAVRDHPRFTAMTAKLA